MRDEPLLPAAHPWATRHDITVADDHRIGIARIGRDGAVEPGLLSGIRIGLSTVFR